MGLESVVTISVLTPFGVSVVIVTFTMVLLDGADRTIEDEWLLAADANELVVVVVDAAAVDVVGDEITMLFSVLALPAVVDSG